jgi:hypothetical protein
VVVDELDEESLLVLLVAAVLVLELEPEFEPEPVFEAEEELESFDAVDADDWFELDDEVDEESVVEVVAAVLLVLGVEAEPLPEGTARVQPTSMRLALEKVAPPGSLRSLFMWNSLWKSLPLPSVRWAMPYSVSPETTV